MSAQKGKDILLKIEEPADSGTFISMAGLRAKTISLNAGSVDVTHADSPGEWRELLAGAGVKTATVSGSGVFKDAAADATVRSAFFAGDIRSWQLIVPDFGSLTGSFQIASLDYAGEFDQEAVYSLTLSSAGELIFGAI